MFTIRAKIPEPMGGQYPAACIIVERHPLMLEPEYPGVIPVEGSVSVAGTLTVESEAWSAWTVALR